MEKDLWRSIHQDAYELAMPARNPYSGNSKRPQSMERLYDSTAVHSVFRLANRLLMELTPPEQIWFDLKAGPLAEMAAKQRKETGEAELEKLNEFLGTLVPMLAMVFRSGNFVSSIWESYLDMIITNTGAMLCLENSETDIEPVYFENVPQAEIAIDEGPHGMDIYRRRKIKIRMIERLWSDAKLPEDLQKIMREAKSGEDPEVELLEVTYKDVKAPLWYYEILWKKDNDPQRLVSRQYTSNPWIVFRWSKIPGTPYGMGPVLLSLPDIRTANRAMEMVLKNAALAMAGMYMVEDDGVVNIDQLRVIEGGMIPVASTGGAGRSPSMASLDTGRNFDIGQIVMEDLRTNIKKGMFDNALPPLDGNVRSATEIIQRIRELTADIGGAIGRIVHELIVPLVRRVADILVRRGMLDPIAQNIDQYNLKVQVNSPLARVQQMNNVERVVQWHEIGAALGGAEMMFLASDIETVIPWIGDQIGVPDHLMRDQASREALQKQVAQIIAAQQMQTANANQIPVAEAA
jgi:hypothetical protein